MSGARFPMEIRLPKLDWAEKDSIVEIHSFHLLRSFFPKINAQNKIDMHSLCRRQNEKPR